MASTSETPNKPQECLMFVCFRNAYLRYLKSDRTSTDIYAYERRACQNYFCSIREQCTGIIIPANPDNTSEN